MAVNSPKSAVYVSLVLLISFLVLQANGKTSSRRRGGRGGRGSTRRVEPIRVDPVRPDLNQETYTQNEIINDDDLCSLTDYPVLCRSTVGDKTMMDANMATEYTINALIVKTRSAMADATRVETMMDVCIDNFDDALDNLVSSLKNLQYGDKPSMSVNLSTVLTDFQTCRDSFAKFPDMDFPLDDVVRVLEEMVSNSLALACAVQAGEPDKLGYGSYIF